MKKHLLLTTFLTIANGFAAVGDLINEPMNQYAYFGETNYTMSCSSNRGSISIRWFRTPVGGSGNLTIASGSTVNANYSHMYFIDQPPAYGFDSNLVIRSPDNSTAGTFTCSDSEAAASALLVVYYNRSQSSNASDNLPIGDVIRYTCQLAYAADPFFIPTIYLERFLPYEYIANTTSPQLEISSSIITATATFYQTVSCLSFLNMQCVLNFEDAVASLPLGTATNAPSTPIEINLPTVNVSCAPSIIGAVSGSTFYFGGMLTCQLTVARPVNYTWTDLTYGNSSRGPLLTVWHDGSYECTASINPGGTLSSPTTAAVYNLSVEKPSVTVRPLYGPIAGGTKVSLTLLNWSKEVSNITAVYLGDILISSDLQTDSVDNNFVMTTPNVTAALIGQPLPITIEFTPGQYNISYSLSFTYRGNPEITDINPSTFVVTGGTIVNVTGTQLSSVANPLIKVTIVVGRGGNFTTNESQQPCEVNAEDGSQMTCLMPPVKIPDDFLQALDNLYISRHARDTNSMNHPKAKNPFLQSRHKRYANVLSLIGQNGKDSLDVYLGLILDGYKKYDNINDVLSHIQILLFSPPEITSTGDIIEFDPNQDESISIKGKYMQRGCRIDYYVVHVGVDICENIDLTDNQLSCRPPKQQPQSTKNGSIYCDQRPSIFIHLGFKTYQYACIKYSSRLPTLTIIGLAVGLSSFVIIILLIIAIVCCCKRSGNRSSKSTDNTLGRSAVSVNETFEPPSNQLNRPTDDSYLAPSVQSSYIYPSEVHEPPSDQAYADDIRPSAQSPYMTLYASEEYELNIRSVVC